MTDTLLASRIRGAARVALLAIAVVLGAPALAAPTLTLDAQARAAVANDEMIVTLAAEHTGSQLAPLNDYVLARLNAAIAEARTVAGVRPRLGSVWTHPVTDREGKPIGWRVRGEIVLESRELQALGQLAGRLAEKMQLAGVSFRLSHERRQQEEKRLLAEAAAAFRARAQDAAAAFGFGGYRITELSLREQAPPPPRPMFSARAEAAAMPLPAESGESEVVVGVSGKVVLQ